MADQIPSGSEEQARTVAIAVDGSPNSREAYKYYLSNIRRADDKLYLLYCIEFNRVLHSPDWYNSPFASNEELLQMLIEEEQKRIKHRLETFAVWLNEDGVTGTVRSVNAESPGQGILKTAGDLGVTLLITGSRGFGTVKRTVLGSVSDYILHNAPISVLVVRSGSN